MNVRMHFKTIVKKPGEYTIQIANVRWSHLWISVTNLSSHNWIWHNLVKNEILQNCSSTENDKTNLMIGILFRRDYW